MSETTDGHAAGAGSTDSPRPTSEQLLREMAADSRRRWSHLSDEEYHRLHEVFDDPRNRMPALDDDLLEPVIGWSVVFPKDGTLAELLFRDETVARQTAATIPSAVVSSFSTPDTTWHRWEDRD